MHSNLFFFRICVFKYIIKFVVGGLSKVYIFFSLLIKCSSCFSDQIASVLAYYTFIDVLSFVFILLSV